MTKASIAKMLGWREGHVVARDTLVGFAEKRSGRTSIEPPRTSEASRAGRLDDFAATEVWTAYRDEWR